MPRSVNLITVFLASPSDVQPEREIVSLCIQQWNQIYGFQNGIYFELLKWETTIAAGFGSDGQNVINENLPDYDLFIGLFWTRLGTQTPRASSGTVEEYERVLAKRNEGSQVEIAFYFKEGAVDIRKVDLSQADALKKFEERVHSEGAFSKVFTDGDSLRYETNLLLDRVARRFPKSTGEITITSPEMKPTIASPTVSNHDDEIGLLDINENIENHSKNSIEILGKITEGLNLLTADLTKSTTDISDISKISQPSSAEIRPIISFVSGSMDKFSDILEESIPDFSENSAIMTNNIRDLIRVSYDFIGESEDSLDNVVYLRENLSSLVNSIEVSGGQMKDFRNTVFSLQRMTSNFNKSKKKLVDNLDNLLDRMNSMKVTVSQSLDDIDDLINFWSSRYKPE